jgi:hypothetical protein
MKVVYKYGTGQQIPKDAKYLCTQVETIEGNEVLGKFTRNLYVWHYYELELPPIPAAEEKRE